MSEHKALTDERLEQLLDVGRSIVAELDREAVLGRVLDAARDLTGARYAALGVLNEDRSGLERFLHAGIDEETRREIGPLPRGRGVLGELIRHPTPLRLADVGTHPRSYGFPPKHPEMKTFLGTPVLVRGEAWGNLYLTQKEGGAEFDEGDEEVAVVLAAWAGVAIENARLYDDLDKRREELERALRSMEASADLSRTVASGIELPELLELIVKRGRGVVSAGAAILLLSDRTRLEIVATAGILSDDLLGHHVPDDDAWLTQLQVELPDLRGLPVLAAPLELRGQPRGLLVIFGAPQDGEFEADDARVLGSFAANAATTIVTVQAVESEKLRLTLRASEDERRRLARELHDETLQELGALRFLLESSADSGELPAESRQLAMEHVDRGIRNLQGIITELRPAALDDLGLAAAIDALIRQLAERFGVEIDVDVDLPFENEGGARLEPELEATIYRLVQEATNNAIKHAEPRRVSITVGRSGGAIEVMVVDDGAGFEVESANRSFGLVGMEERVKQAGGVLRIESETGRGTEVHAELPLAQRS